MIILKPIFMLPPVLREPPRGVVLLIFCVRPCDPTRGET